MISSLIYVKILDLKLSISKTVTLKDYFEKYHNKPDFRFLFTCTWSGSCISVNIQDAINSYTENII